MRGGATAFAWLMLVAPALADPTPPEVSTQPEHVSLLRYIEGMIADLRRDFEAGQKVQDEKLVALSDEVIRELSGHVIDDRQIVADIRAVDARVSLIDGINAKVDALTARLDRIATTLSDVQSSAGNAGTSAASAIVRSEEGQKSLQSRLDVLQTIVERNSERLTKLETGGSEQAQQASNAVSKLEGRVTAIEASAQGAAWVWQAILAIGAFVAGVLGTWAMVRSAKHETEAALARTRTR